MNSEFRNYFNRTYHSLRIEGKDLSFTCGALSSVEMAIMDSDIKSSIIGCASNELEQNLGNTRLIV